MDPLSVVASVIAVLQAGGAVFEGLHKLSALKNAPKIIVQLNDEVADLQLVINTISALPETIIRKEVVRAAIRKARDAVLALERLIVYDLTKASNRSGATAIDRLKWLGAENKIQSLTSNLHKARLQILTAVTAVNVESTSAIEIHFEGILNRTQNIETQLQQLSVTAANASVQTRRTQKILKSLSEFVELTQVHPSQTGRLLVAAARPPRLIEPNNTRVAPELLLNPTEPKTCGFPIMPATYPSIQEWLTSELVQAFYPDLLLDGTPGDASSIRFSLLLKTAGKPYGGPELLLRVLRPQPSNSKIFIAALNGHLGVIRRIIDEGKGSLLDIDELGNSVLYLASEFFRLETVKFFLDAGSDSSQENYLGISTYMYHWYRYLIVGGCVPGEVSLFGSFNPMVFEFSELHVAVLGLGAISAETAIQSVARSMVDERDRMRITALAYAARRGDTKSVEALLVKGADPNVEDHEGSTPLRDAISSNTVRCVQLLLAAGADPQHLDPNGKGLISHAIFMASDTTVLEVLLSHKIDVNAADYTGSTPIMDMTTIYMTSKEDSIVVKILLWMVDHGANLDLQDSDGNTALVIAMRERSHLMLMILLQLEANYSMRNRSNETLLHHAALLGDLRCLEILQAADLSDLDLSIRNSEGWTFMEIAVFRAEEQEEWSFEIVQDPDPDPLQWFRTIKALSLQIFHIQFGKRLEAAPKQPAEEEDMLLDSLYENWNEVDHEIDMTDQIPGAFPSA
ncbi:hypothetical protein MMC11_009160 [Xylographa trunciseda]|nr:hypothetical protein [Xylographa trunciseda]